MALIKCPECGREVSDRADSCPNCGCPVKKTSPVGTVKIKMPSDIVVGWVGLFSSRNATVTDDNGNVLWEGKHGEMAKFKVDGKTQITINLGGWANQVTGYVYPRKKYTLVQDLGVHMLATYRLSEVDYIDAD